MLKFKFIETLIWNLQSGDSTFQHHLNLGMCLLSIVVDDVHMDGQTRPDEIYGIGGELDLFCYMYFY